MAKAKKAVKTINVTPALKKLVTKKPDVKVTEVASAVTKLTKRNATPIDAQLRVTDKVSKMRAGHNKVAWDALIAKLPCSAAELAKLEILNTAPIVASQFISYALRRGLLEQVPAKK
jgi:hypothetical protein